MKLVPLFEGELRFDEATEVGFPTHGEDGDWLAYVEGDGAVSGARLAGELRWTNHPRRRADGTWLPSFEGVIKTNDSIETSGKGQPMRSASPMRMPSGPRM